MDRNLVYTGAIPQAADMLSTNRNAMVGLGMLAMDVLGSGTVAAGLACTPTSPASLNVQIAPGRLYSLQNVDNTAYSDLALDTAHQILKQGILADAVALGCAAPGTFGFSINYLIQAAYQDSDTNLVTLPYYNSNNPQQAFSGPGNTGTAQATVRKGIIAISAKPGTAATTGTQSTPAADTGFVGLWVVTVANGATTIGSGNISLAPGAPFLSGSFTANYTGFTGAVTGAAQWFKTGRIASIILANTLGTSNANTYAMSNLPANILPSGSQLVPLDSGVFLNSTGFSLGGVAGVSAQIFPGGLQFINQGTSAGWQATGSKGFTSPISFSWVVG